MASLLTCEREESDPHDPFAVAVYNGWNIVGHVFKRGLFSWIRWQPQKS